MRHKTAQSALAGVSYLFLLIGLIALIEMVVRIAQGSFHFNFGILGIAIFVGLRRHSRAWRTCALLFTWYGIITLSVALLICLCGQPPFTAPMLRRFSDARASWLFIPLVMVLLVTLWQYRVLTHPAVRRLFDKAPDEQAEPEPNAG